MNRDSLIISGGHTDLSFAKEQVASQTWDPVIAADSGLRFCMEADVMPDVILGDFDSADSADLRWFQDRVPERIRRFPAKKDETDTELAVRCALEAGADRIVILGGTGNRIDHMLGNLQLLKRILEAGAEGFLVDAHNRIRMIRKKLTLQKREQFGDVVSLLPFTPTVEGLTLTGFVYEVTDFTLESGTARGISNEIREAEATISFREGILLVIESRD